MEASLTDRKLVDITNIALTAELGNRITQAVRNAIELPNPRAREHYRKKPSEYEWGRVIAPEEIGELAACLLSDRAACVTGSNILADGGMTSQLISKEPYKSKPIEGK